MDGEDDSVKGIWLLVAVSTIAWAQTAMVSGTAPETKPAQPQATTAPAVAPVATTPVAGAEKTKPAVVAQAPTANQQSPAATPPTSGGVNPQASMAASLALQRASVMKQVSAISGKGAPSSASFFTVPWMETPAGSTQTFAESSNVPPCDPLPADQLDPLIDDASKKQGVKADLIRSVIHQESGSRPCAVSPKGAQGLMQLMPAIVDQFGVRDPFDPRQNVDAGTRLLKQLLEKYKGDISLALSAYNAGAGRVDREGGIPPIPETINYVNGIMDKLPKQ